MVTASAFKQLALAMPNAIETPHFENTAFKIREKIFTTLNRKESRCCLKLSVIDQSVFCTFDKEVIFPMPDKWGKQGWILVNLRNVKKDMLKDALTTAYQTVLSKK